MKRATLVAATTLLASDVNAAYAQSSRDYISIVGSSTVYPFATVVAERFGQKTRYPTPKIESTGSGGGIKLFCEGVGVQHPDIANSSRAIKKSELEMCAKNGVKDVVEVKIGYDGITVAHSSKAKPVSLSRKELWLALAREVPDPKGGDSLVRNPYSTWNQIDPRLPNTRIEVLGPPPTSGTRDGFVELVMDEACAQFPAVEKLKASDPKRYKAVCQTMREDGAYVEAGENDNLIVQKLAANPRAFGIFGFSFLERNRDRLQGVAIENVEPTFETIASGSYPVSRPLFVYVKKAHVGVIPGIREYVAEFTSPQAWGQEGYLVERGLIPLPEEERRKVDRVAENMTPMSETASAGR